MEGVGMPTARQFRLYQFILSEILAGRGCPTFREMAAHIGSTSYNLPSLMLAALEKKGLMRRVGHSRTRGWFPVGLMLAPMALDTPAGKVVAEALKAIEAMAPVEEAA